MVAPGRKDVVKVSERCSEVITVRRVDSEGRGNMSRRVGLLDWHSKLGISQEAVDLIEDQELTVGPLTNASWNIICPSDFVE